MSATRIEWADTVWNPIVGCFRVSAGCDNCYAMRFAHRGLTAEHRGLTTVKPGRGVDWTGKVRLVRERLGQPLRWRKPRRVFVNSLSDLFAPALSNEDIAAVFGVMAAAPHHQFLVLTKRPERMRGWFTALPPLSIDVRQAIARARIDRGVLTGPAPHGRGLFRYGVWPLPNVWLGVSVEDQATADARIPLLLQTPAAVRWVSAEPLLGPVDLEPWLQFPPMHDDYKMTMGTQEWRGLDWVVAGGESGPGARPMHPDWARSLRGQCAEAEVAFFFKQWGEWAPVDHVDNTDHFYLPLPESNPMGTRQCRVQTCVLHGLDGERFDGNRQYARPAYQQGTSPMMMMRVGKQAAGRLLDGREHNEMPAVVAEGGQP